MEYLFLRCSSQWRSSHVGNPPWCREGRHQGQDKCLEESDSLAAAGRADALASHGTVSRLRLCLCMLRFLTLCKVIIRFVMPQDDHTLKKLLLLYWEIVPKTSPDGKLLHEMILVCDAYRKVC